MLVLETPVEALDDPVRLGCPMARPDVAQLAVAGDEVDEVGALEGRAIVGHDRERLGTVVGEREPEEALGLADREFE